MKFVSDKNTLVFIFLLFIQCSFGQYFGDEIIDQKRLSAWNTDSVEMYSGTYHFGFSEAEAEFSIIISDSVIIAQAKFFRWVDEGHWLDTFQTFTDVRIEGDKFFSNESNGEFVSYKTENLACNGLLLYTPFTYPVADGGEFGSYIEEVYLKGMYPEASLRVMEKDYLKSLSLQNIGLMRNEIYARYGYKFRSGGKMDEYFKSQDWYVSSYESVDEFLTEIELINISRIKEVEESSR